MNWHQVQAHWDEEQRRAQIREHYAGLSIDDLGQCLEETQKKLNDLKETFPDWQAWLGGYGPGNEPPDYVKEIRQLEEHEPYIKLELVHRQGEGVGPAVEKRMEAERKKTSSKRLPAPIKPVGAHGYGLRRMTPMQLPPDPPTALPNDLWPRTVVILGKARKRFTDREQVLEMCLHVTSDLAPLLLAMIQHEKMKPHEALSAMKGVLHSILVYNDDGVKSGFPGLSDKQYRVEQELRNSDEWLKFAMLIADAGSEHSADKVPSESMDRRVTIEAFIARVSDQGGRKISRKDIWLVAGYQDATEFERFQRDDSRTTASAAANFRRLLRMESKDFVSLLQSRQEKQEKAKK